MGKKYDAQCDVYSFGITLWEMCARKVPFGGEGPPYVIAFRVSTVILFFSVSFSHP